MSAPRSAPLRPVGGGAPLPPAARPRPSVPLLVPTPPRRPRRRLVPPIHRPRGRPAALRRPCKLRAAGEAGGRAAAGGSALAHTLPTGPAAAAMADPPADDPLRLFARVAGAAGTGAPCSKGERRAGNGAGGGRQGRRARSRRSRRADILPPRPQLQRPGRPPSRLAARRRPPPPPAAAAALSSRPRRLAAAAAPWSGRAWTRPT